MIGFADAQGVAFAAIQGLHRLVQQKDTELRSQEREMTELKRTLQAIEAKLGLNQPLGRPVRGLASRAPAAGPCAVSVG